MLILSKCKSGSDEDCAVHVRACGNQTIGRHEHCRDSHGLCVQGLSERKGTGLPLFLVYLRAVFVHRNIKWHDNCE
jgi:hypothetical protein